MLFHTLVDLLRTPLVHQEMHSSLQVMRRQGLDTYAHFVSFPWTQSYQPFPSHVTNLECMQVVAKNWDCSLRLY